MGMAAGCSNDEVLTSDGGTTPSVNDGDKVFMSVNVKLPTAGGTRSETTNNGQSNSGVEIGKDYENNVSTMLIVLTDKNNKIITHATVANLNTEGAKVEGNDGTLTIKNANVTVTASFKKTAIANYYTGENVDANEALKDNSVRVYTFCNYTADLLTAVESNDDEWYNKTCTVTENANGSLASGSAKPWNRNSFLMSNTTIATRKIPAKLNDWNNYAYATSPFNLSGSNGGGIDNGDAASGNIHVMRSVARFDFKDGSGNNNTYWVGEEATAKLKMKLTKMALVNMSKNFYYLPRVSANGLDANSVICGSEKSTNYVVTPWAAEKQTVTEEGAALADESYRMRIDLAEGKYRFVAYGGIACARSSFIIHPVPGSGTLHTDLRVSLDSDCLTTPERRNLHSMFWGELTMSTADRYSEGTVHMMKNTNNIRVMLQQVDGLTVDNRDYDFSIEDDNTLFGCDNDLIPAGTVTYTPWSRGQTSVGIAHDGGEASVAYAELSVSRLMVKNSPRLIVRRRSDGAAVIDIPLNNYLLAFKSDLYPSMGKQEFLDRKSEWPMIFFLGHDMEWLDTHIQIDDWIVRINDYEGN